MEKYLSKRHLLLTPRKSRTHHMPLEEPLSLYLLVRQNCLQCITVRLLYSTLIFPEGTDLKKEAQTLLYRVIKTDTHLNIIMLKIDELIQLK